MKKIFHGGLRIWGLGSQTEILSCLTPSLLVQKKEYLIQHNLLTIQMDVVGWKEGCPASTHGMEKECLASLSVIVPVGGVMVKGPIGMHPMVPSTIIKFRTVSPRVRVIGRRRN
jgi:hypothetical protein